MKLIFRKDEESQISVFQNIGGDEKEFSYVDMIKALIELKEMEEPEILGGFTDAEATSIKRMVEFINKEIGEKQEDESVETDLVEDDEGF